MVGLLINTQGIYACSVLVISIKHLETVKLPTKLTVKLAIHVRLVLSRMRLINHTMDHSYEQSNFFHAKLNRQNRELVFKKNKKLNQETKVTKDRS